MDMRKVLLQSRKMPAQDIEKFWENIYKHNVKMDTLSSILAFYLHHRVYPPPVQRAFDALLISFTDNKVPKKLRNLLFQTVEEMCPWLSPSCITDTVKLSTSPSVVAELLPCFLVNKEIPQPDAVVFERLVSSLTSPGLSQEDRCKVLSFLMTTLPVDLHPTLNKQLIIWLSYCRTSQTTGSLFRSADVTEVDGSPSVGACTALTLVSTVTDLQVLSLVAFSNIRRYLHCSRGFVDNSLINAVFSYCSTLLAQASKKPNSLHDKQLITELLEEVLLVLRMVRKLDACWASRCQLILGNVQLLSDQLRLTGPLLYVWQYHLTQEEDSVLTDRILGSIVRSEFSQGQLSQRVTSILAAHGPLLTPGLAKYTPNLLKLVATHPSSLVEDFLDIIPLLTYDQDIIVEVLHSLLDLPMLSASICVHQTSLLVQSGFKVPGLVVVRQQVDGEHKAVFKHMMRSLTLPDQTPPLLKLYPAYWSVLAPVLALGLVQVAAQVAPLLLEAFLDSALERPKANHLLLPALLERLPLLCPLSTYQKAVFEVVTGYVSRACSLEPELLDDRAVVQFLSYSLHSQLCPQLFDSLVSAVGDHVKAEHVIVSYFDTLEALLREMLAETTEDLKLETTISRTLAKLASRNVNLIPRAITSLEKLGQTFQNSEEERKEVLSQHAKELVRLLKNPRVANVVLSPSSKEDVAVSALMRVLFHFLD